MAWKSREGKLPPAQFYADVLGQLISAYPQATLDREVMLGLRDFFVNEWRNGQNGRDAAAATCSCDGQQVVPSPAASVFLAKRAVLPPKQAKRGTPDSPPEPFGEAELREPASMARLRSRHAKWLAEFNRLNGSLATVNDLATAVQVQPAIGQAVQRRAQLAAEILAVEGQLKALSRVAGLRNPPPVELRRRSTGTRRARGGPSVSASREGVESMPTGALNGTTAQAEATPKTPKSSRQPKVRNAAQAAQAPNTSVAPNPAKASDAAKAAKAPNPAKTLRAAKAAKTKPAAAVKAPANPLDASEFANLLAAELAADQSSKGN